MEESLVSVLLEIFNLNVFPHQKGFILLTSPLMGDKKSKGMKNRSKAIYNCRIPFAGKRNFFPNII